MGNDFYRERKVTLKTDASVRSGDGVGMGFNAVIQEGDGNKRSLSGKKYIPVKRKTTEAETLATAYGVKEVFSDLERECENYRLIIETDCEKTVKVVKENDRNGSDAGKIINFISKKFDGFTIQWIPRSKNTNADSRARTALDEGVR